jgi:hypothetical protein
MKKKKLTAKKPRGDWGDISPVTKIVENKKKKNDRNKIKQKLKGME